MYPVSFPRGLLFDIGLKHFYIGLKQWNGQKAKGIHTLS